MLGTSLRVKSKKKTRMLEPLGERLWGVGTRRERMAQLRTDSKVTTPLGI